LQLKRKYFSSSTSRPVHNPNSRINDKTLYNYFINDWEQNLTQHSNGKLCTYVTKVLSLILEFGLCTGLEDCIFLIITSMDENQDNLLTSDNPLDSRNASYSSGKVD
jgi:hypothetical protein